MIESNENRFSMKGDNLCDNLFNLESLSGQEELIHKILGKFELLMNKEEYYNYQERVHKLNKAFCAITKAKNLSVSNFNENVDLGKGQNQGHSSLEMNLEMLSTLLDDLIREKENGCFDKMGMITSSSDEGESEPFRNREKILTQSSRKKSFIRNLYNYEMILKTYLYEKNISNSNDPMQMLEDLVGNVTANFSTNNMTLLSNKLTTINESSSLCSTPYSKFTSEEENSNKNSTPMIKKSFFEDKDTKKTLLENRRRSLIEEPKINLGGYGQHPQKRKSSFIQYKNCHSYSNNKKPEFRTSEEKSEKATTDQNEISQFNCNLNSKESKSLAPYFNPDPAERRESIFRDRDNFLTHILENEEYYTNMSIDRELNSDGDAEGDF
jgi:hypothetical protein